MRTATTSSSSGTCRRFPLDDRRCLGPEALIRWRRSGGGGPPGDFIPLVENTPLSGLLTYWAVDTESAEVGDWLSAHPEAHLSINVRPEILGRGGLEYASIKSGLRELSRQIILEVTERGIPDQLGMMVLNAMPKHDVRVALDDVMMNGTKASRPTRNSRQCEPPAYKLDRAIFSPARWRRVSSSLTTGSRRRSVASLQRLAR